MTEDSLGFVHGASAYRNKICRCTVCKAGHNEEVKAYAKASRAAVRAMKLELERLRLFEAKVLAVAGAVTGEPVGELLDAGTLEAARQTVRRRPSLSAAQLAQARQLAETGTPIAQLARAYGVSRPSLSRWLAQEEDRMTGAAS